MNTITIGEKALALSLPKEQTFDEWLELGRNLASANKTLNWWIGDWWAAGSHRYGQRAKVAAEGIFGREFQTLANFASVSRSFETSRRRETLSFNHHEAVASLDPAKADELLERAERDNWTVRDIRAEASAVRSATNPIHREPMDREEIEWNDMVRSWNRGSRKSRKKFMDAKCFVATDGTDGTDPLFDG